MSQGCNANIRRALIKADLVDCIATFPGQLFSSNMERLRRN